MTTKIIYATRIAGDRYNLTFSYDAGMDREVTGAYVQRLAREDRASVELNNSQFGGDFPSWYRA
jgi:hypothetical protein